MKALNIAFAAGLVMSAGLISLPSEAMAGRDGHFSLRLPGFSLYIDKDRHHRRYRRKYDDRRYYRKPSYRGRRHYYEEPRQYHGHRRHYYDNQGGL